MSKAERTRWRSSALQAVVLYDSQHGKTRRIAEVIAEVLERHYNVRLIAAGEASRITERPDLLVVGSPTYHCRATKAIWAALRGIPDTLVDNLAVAVFDTRYNRPGSSLVQRRSASLDS